MKAIIILSILYLAFLYGIKKARFTNHRKSSNLLISSLLLVIMVSVTYAITAFRLENYDPFFLLNKASVSGTSLLFAVSLFAGIGLWIFQIIKHTNQTTHEN